VAQVQSQGSPCDICYGKKWKWEWLLSKYFHCNNNNNNNLMKFFVIDDDDDDSGNTVILN
jgi:hypothetical protein